MKKNNYIIGNYNLISMYSAIQLKLTALQVEILNMFILNWLADRFEKYDENNQANQLFYFNIYFWAKYFGINKRYLKYNLEALTKPITCIDGTKIQIMFKNTKHKGMYLGMQLSIIQQLVNQDFYNYQCEYWKKYEFRCYEKTESIINDMKPVFEIEDNINREKRWSEAIVKELCEMALKENIQLVKNGKIVNVFSHLKNGEFKKQRKGIDAACRLIDDLYTGQFFRKYPVHALFGEINPDHIEFKNAKLAVERIMFLKGNKEGIKKFLLRCARNYFIALKPGQETYQKMKSAFPVTVKDFILFDDYRGNHVANFLLFYSAILSAKDKQIQHTITRVKNIVPVSVFKILCSYEDFVLEKQIQSFWLNVYKLSKEIKSIIDDNGTSYSMASCFDIVFKKINTVAAYHKIVLPGYFDVDQQTVSRALIELQDK